MSEATITCSKCNDTGKVVEHTPPEVISDTITMTGGFISHLCECRRAMPRIRGKASWWTLETVKTITAPLMIDEATIAIETELPISEDNRPLIRDRANFWWPSCAKVDLFSDTLLPGDLRSIAKAMLEAADWMDVFDQERAGLVEVTR